MALIGWQKALPEEDIRQLASRYVQAYVDQLGHYFREPHDEAFALRLDNTDGAVHEVLLAARMSTRNALLDSMTEIVDNERRFARGPGVRDLKKTERKRVEAAFKRSLKTIPDAKREAHEVFYDIKDIVGKKGFGSVARACRRTTYSSRATTRHSRTTSSSR